MQDLHLDYWSTETETVVTYHCSHMAHATACSYGARLALVDTEGHFRQSLLALDPDRMAVALVAIEVVVGERPVLRAAGPLQARLRIGATCMCHVRCPARAEIASCAAVISREAATIHIHRIGGWWWW